MRSVYVFCADGFEEVEGLTAVDLLRRAGVSVTMVSIMGRTKITGARNISVNTDILIEDIKEEADMLVLPGGMPGTMNLGVDVAVTGALKQMNRDGKIVAAICAAPSVLGKCGILEGKKATCYPGFEDKLTGAEIVNKAVVTDGNVITSRGLGTSMEFGFELIKKLISEEKAEEVREQIVFMYDLLK